MRATAIKQAVEATRGVTFSGFSVKQIRKRRKTMTRRILHTNGGMEDLKGSYDQAAFAYAESAEKGHSGIGWYVGEEEYPDEGSMFLGRPWYVGQRLYVRETAKLRAVVSDKRSRITSFDLHYAADDALIDFERSDYRPFSFTRFTPPRFMPRWASRMVLEVTEVRIEALRAMSTADAVREGMDPTCDPNPSVPSALDQFKRGWDEINPKNPWESDPFVWVVSFKWLKGAKVCPTT